MDEDDDMDHSDRLLLSGLIKLSLGVGAVAGLELALAQGAVMLVITSLGAVAALSVAPVLIVVGVATLNASDDDSREWFDAAREVNRAVSLALKPVQSARSYGLDKLWRALEDDSKSGAGAWGKTPAFEPVPVTTKDGWVKDATGKSMKKALGRLSDTLLENDVTPKSESAPRRPPGDMAAPQPSGLDHPACEPRPYDPLEHLGYPADHQTAPTSEPVEVPLL
jgi:hypothetical protein